MTRLQAEAEISTRLAHPLLPFRDFSLAPHSSTLSLFLKQVSPSANTYDFLPHVTIPLSLWQLQPESDACPSSRKDGKQARPPDEHRLIHRILVHRSWQWPSPHPSWPQQVKFKRLGHSDPFQPHGTLTGHRYSHPDLFLLHSQVTPSKGRTCAWSRVKRQGHGGACNPHLMRLSFTGLSGEAQHLLQPGKANKSVTLGGGK